MDRHLERALSVVLTLCCILLLGILIRREFGPQGNTAVAVRERPVYHSNWRTYAELGHRIGPADAPIVLIEFSDFECSYCRRFAAAVDGLRRHLGDSLALVYVHYPLTDIHRFAMPAAHASECAAAQGRFREFHDVLFAGQDSLGLKTWGSFASDAGIGDHQLFDTCMSESDAKARVDRGIAAGKKLGISGTPTVLLNGWLFKGALSDAQLERAVRSVLSGEAPEL